MTTYPDMNSFGWTEGIHKAPAGYEHPWLVVTASGTVGAWSHKDARRKWRSYRETDPADRAEYFACGLS